MERDPSTSRSALSDDHPKQPIAICLRGNHENTISNGPPRIDDKLCVASFSCDKGAVDPKIEQQIRAFNEEWDKAFQQERCDCDGYFLHR